MNRILLLLSVVVFLIWTCEKVEPVLDNPLDPDNPVYEPPQVAITSGPAEGEIVDTAAVTFGWEGNEQNMSYRTKFDSSGWGVWSTSTTQTFDYLDEGEHSFIVQSQYITGDTSKVMEVTFLVNAVGGPALMFYPRRRVASVGDTVTFQILVEEVDSLAATEFSVSFDPVLVRIESLTQGSIFLGSGESIFHSEFDNNQGNFLVLTAILGGDEPTISGTGVLAVLKLVLIGQNDVMLSFNGTQILRGPNNRDISIAQTVDGYIDVQ